MNSPAGDQQILPWKGGCYGTQGYAFADFFEKIGPEDNLLEAGLDSVDLLDAVATIEKLFDIAFERDELIGIATLAELVEVVTDRLFEERGEDFSL